MGEDCRGILKIFNIDQALYLPISSSAHLSVLAFLISTLAFLLSSQDISFR